MEIPAVTISYQVVLTYAGAITSRNPYSEFWDFVGGFRNIRWVRFISTHENPQACISMKVSILRKTMKRMPIKISESTRINEHFRFFGHVKQQVSSVQSA